MLEWSIAYLHWLIILVHRAVFTSAQLTGTEMLHLLGWAAVSLFFAVKVIRR